MSIAYPYDKRQTQQSQQATTVAYETYLKVQQELQRANRRIRQLEQELHQERATKRLERELRKKKDIKPAEKLIITELQRQIDNPVVQDDEGYSRFCYTTAAINIGMSDSTPKRKIEAILEQWPDCPIEMKEVEEHTEDGKKIPRLYIKPKNKQNIIEAAINAKIENVRKQGGNKYICQKCGSKDIKIIRRLHCNCCGHEADLEDSYPNGRLNNNTSKSNLLLDNEDSTDSPNNCNTGATSKSNLLLSENEPTPSFFDGSLQLDGVLKPDTPPCMNVVNLQSNISEKDPIILQTEAAQLLVAIAGDGLSHIGMNRRGENKYRTIPGCLSLNEAIEHLQGKETYGAFCSRADGRTRALCWDVDTPEEWEEFRSHARTLATVGYFPILESSPAGRGGHLWIIFNELVDAVSARLSVYAVVPTLADIKEYWPAPEHGKGNRVRLPGGRYLRPGINEWCNLLSVLDGEISTNGDEAAQLLIRHQTPANIIPSPDPSDQKSKPILGKEEHPTIKESNHEEQSPIGLGQVDARWEQQYGQTPEGKRLWFAWTEEYLIARYNASTRLEDLISVNRQGKALATWRGERTPSVAICGEQWTDFGASARRTDGSQDSGDAFELSIRLSGQSKSQVLAKLGKDLSQQARQELESAARNGEPIPTWLEEILTDAGREHYQRLRLRYQMQASISEPQVSMVAQSASQREHKGGANGFLFPQESIPVSNLETSEPSRQLREIGEAVPSSLSERQQLEAIRTYGIEHKWPALVIDDVEIISEGSSAWLDFVWLSKDKHRRYQVFQYIQG